jgi:hypothetical protein
VPQQIAHVFFLSQIRQRFQASSIKDSALHAVLLGDLVDGAWNLLSSSLGYSLHRKIPLVQSRLENIESIVCAAQSACASTP